MQRDLVERRGWISKKDYVEGLALAQLAPGPLAAQLAIYLGWVRAGTLGATLVGAAFILPSFVMVLALSALYVRFGGLPWMQGAFYGIGAAVIAIIARSALKLVQHDARRRTALLWALFAVSAVVTAWTEREIVWLFLAERRGRARREDAPALGARARGARCRARRGSSTRARRRRRAGRHAVARSRSTSPRRARSCSAAGWRSCRSSTAASSDQFHWLTERQFLDAVAVAMITPGPVVITVAFIGYLVAGPLGATLAAVGVFLPCYLFVDHPGAVLPALRAATPR